MNEQTPKEKPNNIKYIFIDARGEIMYTCKTEEKMRKYMYSCNAKNIRYKIIEAKQI